MHEEGGAFARTELIEGVAEELGHDEEMLAVIKVVAQPRDGLLGLRVLPRQVCEQLDLAQARIQTVLVVAQHLDRDHGARLDVVALEDAGEGALADGRDDAVAPDEHRADAHVQIARLLQSVDLRVVQQRQREVRQSLLLLVGHLRRIVEDGALLRPALAVALAQVAVLVGRRDELEEHRARLRSRKLCPAALC